MNTAQLREKVIQQIVRQSVREAIASEFMKLRASLVPYVADAEQRDIEARHKKPARKTARSFSLNA